MKTIFVAFAYTEGVGRWTWAQVVLPINDYVESIGKEEIAAIRAELNKKVGVDNVVISNIIPLPVKWSE